MTRDEIKDIFVTAEKEIKYVDMSDCIYFAHKYFKCGDLDRMKYYYAFGAALSIIGKEHKTTPNSDYHNGIAYLAKKANVSPSEIKSIRKTFRKLRGFCYRLPYTFDIILKNMIELLVEIKDKEMIKDFVERYKGYSYRDILAGEQYISIEKSLKNIENELGDVKSRKIKYMSQIKDNIKTYTEIIDL